MIRLYKALLHLYPASFRTEYADEMAAVFVEQTAGDNRWVRLALLLEAVAEVVPKAVALHFALLGQDLRYTARTLRHSRGFALTAVLVVALGVGANAAGFSVAEFVLLRPLPYPEPHELVRMCEGPKEGGGWGCMNQMSPANYRDFKGMSSSFAVMGAFYRNATNLVGGGEPQRLSVASVTSEVLPLLGVRPVLGRVFDTTSAGQADRQAVVLGYGLWQSQFGGDLDVLGRTVRLNGRAHQVIGVMPASFDFPSRDVELWTPLLFTEEDYADRRNTYLEGIGRLRDGVTLEQARADLAVVTARLSAEYPETGSSLFYLRDEMSPRFRVLLLALCGAGLCMLLLTCANLANLLLARAAQRERELAVRAALGAGRERLVRQLITESAVLAIAGGAAGLVVAALAVPLLAHMVPATLPIAGRPSLDFRIVALAALFTGLTGLGFGLLPALRAGGTSRFGALNSGVRGGGGRRQRLRVALVTVEVGVSVVLLISCGVLLRAAWRVEAVDPGFEPARVLTLKTALSRPKYDSPVRRGRFYDRVLSGVRSLPGVESAAYTTGLPMVVTGGIWRAIVPGQEDGPFRTQASSLRFVTPQYFRTLGIPILQGRDVQEADSHDSPFVAVVSESFVQRHWPREDPIGKRFEIAFYERIVVGVVGDTRVRGLERPSEPQVYLPAPQVPEGGLINYDPKDLVIRVAAGSPSAILPAVRRIVRGADPDQPISDVRTMDEVVAGQTEIRRAQLSVLGALAAVALLLTGVGIHGLLAYTVSQRSQEIGVRLALGARPAGIAGMIAWEGARLGIMGVVPGVILGYLAARAMGSLLFGVEPGDPPTIGAAVVLGVVMALAGSLVPAVRAVRVDPMTAMRVE